MTTPYTVYFAGALFNHKDLLGNAMLAASIETVSQGQYICVLPQNFEQGTGRAVDIRNQDFAQLMACDLGIFNFDGSDLDSGTVVEFIFAKCLDIPAVILRSDFRASGDQQEGGDAWNLMCSFYPRTKVVQCHAMAWYQQARQEGGTLQEVTQRFYTRVASVLIEHLEAARHESPLLKGTAADVERLYRWALRFPGSGLEAQTASEIDTILARKRGKGLV
jgi:nucleoside 2-deoxyribosyltransferase